MDKRFWGIIALIAVVFVGIIWANNRQAGAPESNNSNATATNHVRGENSKKVTFVEYGDFQCPVCGLYEPTVKQVVDKYQDDIQFQFRHFPLPQIHQNALAASRAAEAASYQNKFWEMHDQIFAGQQAWSTAGDPLKIFKGYAKNLGLNETQFDTDFSSKKANDSIQADVREGEKLKVTGTPSFFLDGKELELDSIVDDSTNQPSADKLGKLIEDAIKAKESGGQQ